MMLDAKGVVKRFGGVDVLKGIDLTVEKGDVVAILGPSGSGKTTFLRCLNFLERADSGVLVFDGERFDLHAATRRDIARCANTGISAFIDQRGRILSRTTWWEPAVLRGSVNLSSSETFFVRAGDIVGRVCVFLFVLLLAAAIIRRK